MSEKARKLHNKRKKDGVDFVEPVGSDEDNDDNSLHSDESFDSDDSDVILIFFKFKK